MIRRHRWAAACGVWLCAGSVAAQPDIAQPIVAVDDTRSEGPVARSWLEIAADQEWVGDVTLQRMRLMLGPPLFGFGPLSPYALRIETAVIESDRTSGGPFTFAVQRFIPIDPLAIAPLLYLHAGVETAVATPWVADHGMPPPTALAVASGVDTELAEHGWSLRPFSPYLRADFPACRSFHLEIGLAPEAFVRDAGGTAYNLRFNGDIGWSLGCAAERKSLLGHVAFDAGYRGRVQLHAEDEPVSYIDQFFGSLQVDLPLGFVDVMVAGLIAHNASDGDTLYGVRLQLGNIAGMFGRGR